MLNVSICLSVYYLYLITLIGINDNGSGSTTNLELALQYMALGFTLTNKVCVRKSNMGEGRGMRKPQLAVGWNGGSLKYLADYSLLFSSFRLLCVLWYRFAFVGGVGKSSACLVPPTT